MPSKVKMTLTIGHHPITGKPIKKSFCGPTKKAVKAAMDKYKIEAATGQKQEYEITTFESWAWQWLDIYKDGTVSAGTYRDYELCINHLNDFFGHRPINTITPVIVQAFFKKKQDLSQSMVNKLRITANSIFETAVDNDLCYKNPMRNLGPFKGKAVTEKHVYTQKQADIVANFALSHPKGLGIYLILKTGLRRGELMGIIPEKDFDFDRARLYMQRTVTDVKGYVNIKDGGKSKSATRVIPLAPDVVSALKNDIRLHKPGYLFTGTRGSVMAPGSWAKYVYSAFLSDLDKYVLDQQLEDQSFPDIPHLTPHELRHTYGTLLFKAGADPYTVQKIMGHSKLDTTMGIYVHDDIEDVEKKLPWVVSN